jgi:hypothetical protein
MARNVPWLCPEAYAYSTDSSSRPQTGGRLPSERHATGGVGVHGIELSSQSVPVLPFSNRQLVMAWRREFGGQG